MRLTDPKHPRQFAFAVNIDPDESDPTSLTTEEMKSPVRQTAAGVLRPSRGPGGHDPPAAGGAVSLRDWFLAAVLIGLVAETLMANRLAKKVVPPGTLQKSTLPSRPGSPPAGATAAPVQA